MIKTEIILAIDPGTKKCGYALVDSNLTLLSKNIIYFENLSKKLEELFCDYRIGKVILGDGTNYKKVESAIRQKFPRLTIKLVDERFSTLKARKRYFEMNPPRGIFKLIPVSLRIPPRDYDDIVALLLAENYFESLEDTSETT